MKRILILAFAMLFGISSIGFAAVSGAKSSGASSAPKMSTTQSATTKQAAPSTSSDYKPSAPASSYSEKAPAAKTATPAQTAQPSSSGGFMRNLATFGGGMLMGSMLGHMFGFGHSGFFADMIGMLFNIMMLAGIFMGGRYLWNKYQERKKEKNNWRNDA